MQIKDGITYDDVLLVPKYSEISSRKEVNLSVNLNNFTFDHPIIVANMQSLIGYSMMEEIVKLNGLAILHRFIPLNDQIKIVEKLIKNYTNKNIGISVGIKDEDLLAIEKFYNLGVRIICIDIAHGDSLHCINMIKSIKNKYNDVLLIAGNVATGTGAKRLWKAGADVVKCGIGGGSLCSTRIETGNGVPQLTALIDVYDAREQLNLGRDLYFISDGGIKNAGDIVKSLCFSDMVMVGNIFSGCIETPGNIMKVNGKEYKSYVGSSTHKTNHIEGVEAIVSTKGHYKDILNKLLEGVKSGASYQGVVNLNDLKKSPEFVKISNSGLKESHPHDVIVI